MIVGAGPNGLAAAITLARSGLAVEVHEAADRPGGGCRTDELTVPGFRHDVCSAVHPMAVASPFFRSLDLARHGLRLRTPEVMLAHPLDGGRAASVVASVAATASSLGADGPAYRRIMEPLVGDWEAIVSGAMRPLRSPTSHPIAMARFGWWGVRSIERLVRPFESDEARAVLAGVGAHSMLPLSAPLTSAFALILTILAHAVGWPVVEGGTERLIDAMVAELRELGGEVHTAHTIDRLSDLPPAAAVLLDVTPRQLLDLAGDQLPPRPVRALRRFRYGPGVCKVDWALRGPVPWTAEACRLAPTVHVGGTLAEVARSESEATAGVHADRPFCIVVQPSVVDPNRAPAGQHTLWAYCHTPPGSSRDMTPEIEAQIERFAPGFRDLTIARTTRTAADMSRYNANYVGGDINGGAADVMQTVFRPIPRWNTYRTGIRGVYLCSASTPPGGGVHGMCGYRAAQAALRA